MVTTMVAMRHRSELSGRARPVRCPISEVTTARIRATINGVAPAPPPAYDVPVEHITSGNPVGLKGTHHVVPSCSNTCIALSLKGPSTDERHNP